jgi:hypothetical protein
MNHSSRGNGMRPVDVLLGVPLALLPALVERAQLLDLAAVLPRPVELERDVDVELLAQSGDLGLVDEVDDFEVADSCGGCREDGVHRQLLTWRECDLEGSEERGRGG